eukprot:7382752-Prymnesium_polylepis.3
MARPELRPLCNWKPVTSRERSRESARCKKSALFCELPNWICPKSASRGLVAFGRVARNVSGAHLACGTGLRAVSNVACGGQGVDRAEASQVKLRARVAPS